MARIKKDGRRGNGSGSVYKRASGNYCIMYFDVDGRRKMAALKDSQGQAIKSKPEAEAAAETFMADIMKMQAMESKAEYMVKVAEAKKIISQARFKLDDLWDKFLDSPHRPDSGNETLKKYRTSLQGFINWLKSHYRDVTDTSRIDASTAEAFMSDLLKGGIAERTYNSYLQALKLVFRIVLDVEGSENPFSKIHKMTEGTQTRKDFTEEQIRKIFDALEDEGDFEVMHKPQMRAMVNLCCWTGCRGQDACLMTWDAINFHSSTIRYMPLKTKRKTGRSVSVPMHPQLKAALLDALAWKQEESPYILPDIAARYKCNFGGVSKDITKLIEHIGLPATIETEDGVRRKFREVLNPETGKVELVKRRICQYSMHSFRHTFVSFCANAGVPLAVVQEIVGHGNPAMTQHYAHISQETAQKAIDTLPQIGNRTKAMIPEVLDAVPSMDNPAELRKRIANAIHKADVSKLRQAISILEG